MGTSRVLERTGALPDTSSPTEARLRGRQLILARAAWLAVALLTLVMVVTAIPIEFARLQQICMSGDCEHPHLTPESLRELQALGLSSRFFVGYFLTLTLAFVAVWVAAGAIIFWRKSDDRAALFVAFFLVTFGASFPISGTGLRSTAPIWWFLNACVAFLGVISIGIFPYLFPNGRFVPQWTKWPAAGGGLTGWG